MTILKTKEGQSVKRKILGALFALVLVLSFSLLPAALAAAMPIASTIGVSHLVQVTRSLAQLKVV